MKMVLNVLYTVLVWSILLVGCSQQPQSAAPDSSCGELTAADKAALHQSIADNVRFALESDWQSFALLFTDGDTLMPPNAPPSEGRESILEMFSAVTFWEFSSELVRLKGCGDVAYGRGQHSWTLHAAENAQPVSETGTWVAIWRRQEDGQWLIDLDVWTAS